MKRAKAQKGLPPELNEMLEGFKASRVILTAVELDLFTHIGEGAPVAKVAERLRANVRGVEMLLDALVSLGLLVKKEGKFRNGAWADRFLREGAQDDWRSAIKHRLALWQRWSNLTECVKTGTSSVLPRIRTTPPTPPPFGRSFEDFIAAMDKSARSRGPYVADAILKYVGKRDALKLLDLGGGSGGYSLAFVRARKGNEACVFDLPEVTQLTKKYLSDSDVGIVEGDLLKDRFGKGYDVVLLSSVIHMFGSAQAREILRKTRDALKPDGVIAIQEFILDEDRAGPVFATLFALNMLVSTANGASYTEAEIRSLLGDVGFTEIRRVDLSGAGSLMLARA